MKVNGHTIPSALLKSISGSKWCEIAKSPRLAVVFPNCSIVRPSFYDIDAMNLENESWAQESDPVYMGSKSASGQPGDIDPRQSVLIADLGPDRPIALDYRREGEPCVVYLSEDDAHGWIEVAPDIEQFLRTFSEEVSSA